MNMQGYELVSNYREIYIKGNKAFKMYSEEKPFEYVTKMARIQSLAYNAGLPVPAVYGLKNFDGRFALEMDYIEGKHFMDENASEEERITELKIMAKLQCELNAVNSETFNLPSFSTKIAAEIKQTHYLTESVKREVLTLLSRLDTGKTNLCHGDFHSGNVVYDGDKHWIIDWDGAGTDRCFPI